MAEYCKNCGVMLPTITRNIGLDPKNNQVVQDYAVCNCGYSVPVGGPRMLKKGHSALGVTALILSLFVFSFWIGGILAVIDLCINDKTKKHNASWYALIFVFLYLFALGWRFL